MSKRIVLLVALSILGAPVSALAHCDALDGPVVKSARTALDTGKLNPILAWVRAGDEAEVKAVFARALSVRKLGPEARDLADRFFFETVVRVHRAGEGAPYTGLKPAGQDFGPAIAAADRSIGKRSAEEVEKLLVEAVRHGLHQQFSRLAARSQPGENVAEGREWVEAYVPYVHWVEGVFKAASVGGGVQAGPPAEKHAHGEPAPASPHSKH
ncbi:MAG: DUF6448 family protein [Anaeromyxobacteraceae bacterium]|nr:DUF6448 family protein [Anaeromyxobacteraceae bacterium]